MSGAPASTPAWRAWVRRHERRLAVAWLLMTAGVVAVLAFGPTRARALGTLQAASDRWDRRWDLRRAYGSRLLASGRLEEAAAFLERLARDYPAPSAEHGRDVEREQVLRMLARAEEGLGRNARTMAAYDRLIAFDSLNYYNWFLKARAAERLFSGWAVAPEAREAYGRVLERFPNHLPSLRGVVAYHADRSEYPEIAAAYRAYLDAPLLLPVEVAVGDTVLDVPLRVDGRPHAVVLALPRPHAESLAIRPLGLALALGPAAAVPARTVGGRAAPVPVALAAPGARAMTAGAHGAWLPDDSTARLVLAFPRAAAGLAEVRLTVRAFKPVDQALWALARRSYRNLLDAAGLAAADSVTVPFTRTDAADDVLLARRFARYGLAGEAALR